MWSPNCWWSCHFFICIYTLLLVHIHVRLTNTLWVKTLHQWNFFESLCFCVQTSSVPLCAVVLMCTLSLPLTHIYRHIFRIEQKKWIDQKFNQNKNASSNCCALLKGLSGCSRVIYKHLLDPNMLIWLLTGFSKFEATAAPPRGSHRSDCVWEKRQHHGDRPQRAEPKPN